ncbi:MAG: hypothetical protein GC155_18875 [Alphaproteobacteria bacterium]|nr:hypothetical protein [Alphaproteobacteria bacterium]
MKTTLRLAFSAFAVSLITLAAAGAPLPFITDTAAAKPPAPSRLLPPGSDGAAKTEPLSVQGFAPGGSFGAQ